MNGYLCSARVYEYAGWIFEFGYCGPWPLKKNGDPRKRAGRKFYKDIEPWVKELKTNQEACRVGGGCIQLGGE